MVNVGALDHFTITTAAATATAGSALSQPVVVNAYDAGNNLKIDYVG
jgi:hypothetical protein